MGAIENLKPEVRAALLFALWHHQGASSPVGQPIRAMLGIGEHDRLDQDQLAAAKSARPGFDLLAHLRRQIDFSYRTFGPGTRLHGVTDHIAKELQEVRDSNGSLAEWVDVIILAFDGAWRSGATPDQIVAAIVAKQTKNEGRNWPDWRTADPNKAIEHDRSRDGVQA